MVDVDTPDQINAVFDMIAYSKGASVIRMMENFLGERDFRKGLTNFLNKFSFQNAVTEGKIHDQPPLRPKKGIYEGKFF